MCALQGKLDWSIGPGIHHYSSYKKYIIKISAERISDTIDWFSTRFPLPKVLAVASGIHDAHLLIEGIKKPHQMSPLNKLPTQELQAFQKLAKVFSTTLSQ